MRWQRPRRGSELTWLDDPIQGDSWLVLASKPLQLSPVLTGTLQLAYLPLPDTESFETDRTDGLALRLALAEPTREGMEDWVRRYGLFANTPIHDGRWAGSLAAWQHTRADVRWLVAAWFEDAPDIPHAAELREVFLDEAPRPRESAVAVLRRLLRANKTEMDLIGNELWPAGPTFKAQMWGELAVRIATARPFALCAKCGSPFVFQRATSMYCSNTCRVMASRERQTAASVVADPQKNRLFVKPAPGLLVRHPRTMQPLPEDGMDVTAERAHFLRRLRDGDVILVPDPPTAEQPDE